MTDTGWGVMRLVEQGVEVVKGERGGLWMGPRADAVARAAEKNAKTPASDPKWHAVPFDMVVGARRRRESPAGD